jgi:hypothetical protein
MNVILWFVSVVPVSVIQNIYHLLWNPEIYNRVKKSPSLVPVLIQMNPVHNFPPYFSLTFIITLSSDLRLDVPSDLFSSGPRTKILYRYLICPICATCPAHLILLVLILIVFGEAYKLRSSSLFSLLQYFLILSLTDLADYMLSPVCFQLR